jgi:hypothetical protein
MSLEKIDLPNIFSASLFPKSTKTHQFVSCYRKRKEGR